MMSRRIRVAWVSLRRFVHTGNFLRLLVSFLLAFGLWAFVTYQNDPETTRTIGGIPVTVENLSPDLEIIGEPPLVDIQIQGPQSIVNPLERENVVPRIDLTDAESAGQYELEVRVDAPSGVRVREILPENVSVRVDRIGEVTDVPVIVIDPEDVPPNYQVSDVQIEPDQVRVSGPEQTLQRVDHAEVQLSIDGRISNFTESLQPRILDESGQEINGLQISPQEVSVTVTLDVRGQLRKVIPVIVGDDALAPGHELVRTTVLPTDEIVVDGPEDDIANIFFLTTVPIDITGWDGNQIVRDVEIDRSRIPDSVTLEANTVHVSIEIRRQVYQRELSGIPINVMNPAPGTEFVLSEETATVMLEGSRSAIDEITSDEITVFVNVANATNGELELEVQVIVPAQVQYREVTPAMISVEVIPEDETASDEDTT
jgi:YbbR domain-containing protein